MSSYLFYIILLSIPFISKSADDEHMIDINGVKKQLLEHIMDAKLAHHGYGKHPLVNTKVYTQKESAFTQVGMLPNMAAHYMEDIANNNYVYVPCHQKPRHGDEKKYHSSALLVGTKDVALRQLFLDYLTQTLYSITTVQDHHDPAEIVQVINQAYAKLPFIKPNSKHITKEEVTAIMAHPHQEMYLCLHDESHICGTAVIDYSDSKATLDLLSVAPDHQGKNIGDFLIQYIQTELQMLGHKYLYIKVIPLLQEKLISYYEREGFVETGQTELLSEKTLQDKIKPEYWASIYFKVMRKKV